MMIILILWIIELNIFKLFAFLIVKLEVCIYMYGLKYVEVVSIMNYLRFIYL